jgi:hypothetical protein
MASSCERGNEPSGSIKGGEFLDHLNGCQLLKKISALWISISGSVAHPVVSPVSSAQW